MARVKTSEDLARRWALVSFWGVTVAGLAGLGYLISALLSRPCYSSLCSIGLAMLWHYLTQPDSWWHQSQHTENQFWMLVTFLMTSTWMFAPDSPYLMTASELMTPAVGGAVGAALVVGCTTAAHVLDKRAHRSRLMGAPLHGTMWAELRKGAAAAASGGGGGGRASSHAKLEALLSELVKQLGETSLSTLWNLGKYVGYEREILSVFKDCTKEELNYIVCTHEMKLLAYKLKNHNKSTRSSLDLASMAFNSEFSRLNRNRSELMDLLANTRVSDLGIPARVVVLDIISSLRMTAHPNTRAEAELWVQRVLTTIKLDDLSELKQLVDNKGNAESMHKLIWVDLTDSEARRKILAHFKQQARTQAAQMMMRSSLARRRLLKGPWRKILSDVDDTLFSSGGRYPAGIDTSYKRKVFYPGITALYKELDLGAAGPEATSGVWPPSRFGDLVFLSARPHVYKDLTETTMYSKFAKFMQKNDLHCMPSLLPGDLQSGQAYMMLGDFLPMAQKKALNFEQYYSIYPEFSHVFLGDNGQADVKAAEFMVERFGRNVVERVYIRQVQPVECTYGYEPGVSEQKWERFGIVFCKSYIQAALDAATCQEPKPLITLQGLRRVAVAARKEFLKIRWTWKDPYQRDTMRVELNEDIRAANLPLERAGLDLVPGVPGECVFPPGTRVHTGFGTGIVGAYRARDGMYEVFLDWGTGACDPPRLHTVLHCLFPTDKRLKQMQKLWFGSESAAAVAAASGRVRSSTADLDGALLALEAAGARNRLNRPQSVGTMSTASDTSGAFRMREKALQAQAGALGSAADSASGDAAHPAASSPTPGALVPSVQTDAAPGYVCRVLSFPGERAWLPRPSSAMPGSSSSSSSSTPLSTPGGTPRRRTSRRFSTNDLTPSPSPPPPPSPGAAGLVPAFDAASLELLEAEAEADLGKQPAEGTATGVEGGILDVGTRVHTPYGRGTVLRFRLNDSVYMLVLGGHASTMRAFVPEVNLLLWNPKIFEERASAMAKSGSYPSRVLGLMRTLLRRDKNDDPREEDKPQQTEEDAEGGDVVNPDHAGPLEPDAIVRTPFGQGRVVFARFAQSGAESSSRGGGGGGGGGGGDDDGAAADAAGVVSMYEVELVWGARAFLRSGDVVLDTDFTLLAATAADLEQEGSPLQRAKRFMGEKFEMLKLPFSALGFGNGKDQADAATAAGGEAKLFRQPPMLPSSESLLSLSSMVSASSGTSSSSFFSLPEEQQRLGELWKLREGDRVLTPAFGMGTVLEVREDGFFVVQLSFGRAYINVPRVLALCEGVVPVNTRVVTEYGVGMVQAYRASDHCYTIKMERWEATVYVVQKPGPVATRLGDRPGAAAGEGTTPVSQTSSRSDFSDGPIEITGNEQGKHHQRTLSDYDDAPGDDNAGSIKSSLFSFISNILPSGTPPPAADETEHATAAPGSPASKYSMVPMRSPRVAVDAPGALGAIVVGHTRFSFPETQTDAASEEAPPATEASTLARRIPPGHTAYSWNLSSPAPPS